MSEQITSTRLTNFAVLIGMYIAPENRGKIHHAIYRISFYLLGSSLFFGMVSFIKK